MYHIFIPPSVNELLDLSHVLAIINTAAINIGLHVFF